MEIAYRKSHQRLHRRKFFRIIREGNYTSFPGFYGFLMRNCNTLPLSSNKATMKKFIKAVEFSDDKPTDIPLIYEIVR
jgi:hypothetical protein